VIPATFVHERNPTERGIRSSFVIPRLIRFPTNPNREVNQEQTETNLISTKKKHRPLKSAACFRRNDEETQELGSSIIVIATTEPARRRSCEVTSGDQSEDKFAPDLLPRHPLESFLCKEVVESSSRGFQDCDHRKLWLETATRLRAEESSRTMKQHSRRE